MRINGHINFYIPNNNDHHFKRLFLQINITLQYTAEDSQLCYKKILALCMFIHPLLMDSVDSS